MSKTKRLLAVVLTLCMCVQLFACVTLTASAAAWDGTAAASFAGGTGTADDPYIINTPEQLALLSSNVNNAVEGANTAYYKLGADIVFNEGLLDENYALANKPSVKFTPIGVKDAAVFSGTFDGDGHTISGLYVDAGGDFAGLFGNAKDATIKNLTMSDFYIVAYNTGCIGGLISKSQGTVNIDNVVVDGRLGETYNGSNKGMFVGYTNGSVIVSNSIAKGLVQWAYNANKQGISAGFVGMADNYNCKLHFTNCVNYADVIGTGAAGFVGYVKKFQTQPSDPWISFVDCANYGDVTANSTATHNVNTEYEQAMGIAGGFLAHAFNNSSVYFERCLNEGNITGIRSAGALIGKHYKNTVWGSGLTIFVAKNTFNTGVITISKTAEELSTMFGSNAAKVGQTGNLFGTLVDSASRWTLSDNYTTTDTGYDYYSGTEAVASTGVSTVEVLQSGSWLNDTTNWVIKAGQNPALKITVAEEPEAPHEHSYTEEIITAATCATAGEKLFTCECGESYTETIAPTGEHNYVNGYCSVCGAENANAKFVAKIGDKKYETLAAAVAAGGEIVLIDNIYLTETVNVAEGNEVTLDLNGKEITVLKNGERSLYAINNYGKLTIKDSVGTGIIVARGVQNLGNGDLTLESGTITACDTNGGAAVWNEATFTMNGGTLKVTHVGSVTDTSNPGCLNNSGTATINGGKMESVSMRTYALISSGTLTINDAQIDGAHGAVTVDAGTATINGGVFDTDVYYGLYVYSGTVNVTGGTFTKGSVGKSVYVQPDAIEGVEIAGGTFESAIAEEICAEGFIPTANADGTYGVKVGAYVAKIGDKKYETLAAAVAAGGEIVLIDNIYLTETVNVAEGNEVTLDLNGKEITVLKNGERSLYAINNYGKLTIKDSVGTGIIVARGIQNLGNGDLTLESGTIHSCDTNGGAAVWNEATFTMNGGTLKVTHVGSVTDTSNPGCLNNSGTATINGGKMESASMRTYALISTGTLTINDAQVDGAHGAVGINAGTATIAGGVFDTDVHYGLYVSDGTVNVTGGTFAKGSVGVAVYVQPAAIEGVEIAGGTFESAIAEEICAAGFIPTANADGTYGVKVGAYVAKIGDKKYETFAAALAAAKAGDTVELLADVTITKKITLNGITLNGNNHTLDATALGTADSADGTACAIYTNTGCTVQNLTINGGVRGVYVMVQKAGLTTDVVLDNVTIINSVRAINVTAVSNSTATGKTLKVNNSTLAGKLSWTMSVGAQFNNVTFATNASVKGNVVEPRGTTTFTACTFEEGYTMSGEDIATYGGTVTADAATTASLAAPEGYEWIADGASYKLAEKPVGPTYVETLTIPNKNVKFESDYTLGLYVSTSVFNSYKTVYIKAEKACFDGNTPIDPEVVTLTKAIDYNASLKVFEYAGFAAKEMSSVVKATVWAVDEAGNEYYGPEIEYSLRDYAQNQIGKTTKPLFKTMMVDFLNYGAAAQTYFSYNTNDLANANIAEHQDVASPERTYVDSKAGTEETSYAIDFTNFNLEYVNKINIAVVTKTSISDEKLAEMKESWYAIASYTDFSGVAQEVRLDLSNEANFGKVSGYWAVMFNGLASKEMSTPVTVTLYDGEGVQQSNSATYSIETYAAGKVNGTNVKLANLAKSMMKFGDGAAAYFA